MLARGRSRRSSRSTKHGIIAGEHQVTVIPLPPSDGPKPAVPVVAAKYAGFEVTQLKFAVAPDTKEILITIDRTDKK